MSRRQKGRKGRVCHGKKILIIDDDHNLVKYLEILLNDNGYETHGAYNGAEGLEAAKMEKPDLITLDVGMPETDGAMFYAKFSKEADVKDIPVIVITGSVSRAPAWSKNMVVINKPFTPDELLAAVRKAIGE